MEEELLFRSGGVCERAGCDSACFIRHLVRHNGKFRRLCSSCVLLTHPAAFCSACLSLLSPDAPAAACSRCRRFAVHLTCRAPSSSSSVCPSCDAAAERRPSPFSFSHGYGGVGGGAAAAALALDERAARILLVAAQIAHQSVSRAAAEAREEADRRVREAAVARKQSRDALDAAFKLQQPPPMPPSTSSPIPPSTSRRKATKDDWRGLFGSLQL